MADLLFGTASSVLASLLGNLTSEALKEVASICNFKSDLEGLTKTVETIQATILDARESNFHSHALDLWIERVHAVMYDADDLLDEFSTMAERKKLTSGSEFSKKVKTFFSSKNKVVTAAKMSFEIKRIRADLADIAKDKEQFHILPPKEVEPPYVDLDRETGSYVDNSEVIGRDDDKQKIIHLLLKTDPEAHMVILPIVGIGGLGKTTMAQVIFNDVQISSLFEPKIWACIGEKTGLKVILGSIIKSATDSNTDTMALNRLQDMVQKLIGGKKYLLVLDDVWEDSTEVLEKLRSFLRMGGKGCKVIVTSRSRRIAKVIGTVPPYDLGCLSDEFSWNLFGKVAFEAGQEQTQSLVEIGKEIVKKCGKLPLAIRVTGALLRGEDETYWRRFKDNDLSSVTDDVADNIMPLLKLSYHRLKPQLKLCFAFCSLFPKGKCSDKETLCELWIAEGILISSRRSQESLSDVADRCYTDLMQKCFINPESYICITDECFQMHDLMHDLARDVAGKDILDRHLISERMLPASNISSYKLRTLIGGFDTFSQPINVSNLTGKFHCIRMLNLRNSGIKQLPDSLGNLIHLRYLDLSINKLEKLPDSITKLYNLQFLDIRDTDLKVLPEKFCNLVNLRKLYLDRYDGYSGLKYMPPGIGNLHCLERLDVFVVGEAQLSKGNRFPKSNQPNSSGLEELVNLKKLRGSLQIIIKDVSAVRKRDTSSRSEGGYSVHMDKLTELEMEYADWINEDEELEWELLENLQPPAILKSFSLRGYSGHKYLKWMLMNNFSSVFRNLVVIQLFGCSEWRQNPIPSQFPSLEVLCLVELPKLEYIDNLSYKADYSTSTVALYPSLRSLHLEGLRKLKGWWAPIDAADGSEPITDQHVQPLLPLFPHLRNVIIKGCPNFTGKHVICPVTGSPSSMNFGEKLHIRDEESDSAPLSRRSLLLKTKCCCSWSFPPSKIGAWFAEIDNIAYLHNLPMLHLQRLTRLTFVNANDWTGREEEDESLWKSLQRLCDLEFTRSEKLVTLPKGIIYLTALQGLTLYDCRGLVQLPDWIGELATSLEVLSLSRCSKLESLPRGIIYLTALQKLFISSWDGLVQLPEWIGELATSLKVLRLTDCANLESLPEGIRNLKSLEELGLGGCKGLKDRCKEPNGEDWPKIRHIPRIILPDGSIYKDGICVSRAIRYG